MVVAALRDIAKSSACCPCALEVCFFQAEDGIRDKATDWSSDVCSSDLGVLLSVLCGPNEKDALLELLFTETTTLGVRSYEVNRRALQRSVVRVETPYGPIDVKVAHLDGRVVNEMPEFEQCRQAAATANVPLKVVEEAARKELW